MGHVDSLALDASKANRRMCVKLCLAETTLLHHQLFVVDLDIVPVVFGIQEDVWVISAPASNRRSTNPD